MSKTGCCKSVIGSHFNRGLYYGTRPIGRLTLRYKGVCKRDMKGCGIIPDSWEPLAEDCMSWGRAVQRGIHLSEQEKEEPIDCAIIITRGGWVENGLLVGKIS